MGVGIFLVPDGSLSCISRYFRYIIYNISPNCAYLSKKEQMFFMKGKHNLCCYRFAKTLQLFTKLLVFYIVQLNPVVMTTGFTKPRP